MSDKTFLAAVRFKDGSKLKFNVERVPDCIDTVRGIIAHELKDNDPPVQAILLRTDCVQAEPAPF